MNRLNQEIGNIRQTIRNLENPRRSQKGSFNKYMKPAYNLALQYGYDTPKFGRRGFTRRDKEEVLIFLSYVQQDLSWQIETERIKQRRLQKIGKNAKKKMRRVFDNLHQINEPIGVELSFRYLKSDQDAITEVEMNNNLIDEYLDLVKRKVYTFRSTRYKLKKDISRFIERFIQSLGGHNYVFVFEISHTIAPRLPVHNILTVPLRDMNAPRMMLFNDKGQPIVDYINEGNNTCVIDLMFNNCSTTM